MNFKGALKAFTSSDIAPQTSTTGTLCMKVKILTDVCMVPPAQAYITIKFRKFDLKINVKGKENREHD